MLRENVLKDERLIEWLKKRNITSPEGIREFVNPNLKQLYNPFWLKGIKEAVESIKKGIKDNKRFAIVGDYDCDGIMAATILYQYFIRNYAKVKVFIPNRFDDGYGLNDKLSQEILEDWNPDILITVDLGISCVDEINFLKSKGVEVIVTDHHEPQDVLPDCIIIDPKIKQSYPCNFLCGAGVAFKLVSALGGNDFANEYLDIISIATIGDIVPLLSENRAIANVGLERLNKRRFSLPSMKYLFEELKLKHVTSQDIYLKIVPKINSSGRMDNGQKVFEFINSSSKSEIKSLLGTILSDNAERLDKIDKAMKEAQFYLSKWENINTPIVCIKGDFHQGILGIIASRIVSDFEKPAIVFAPTKEGTLKASGRSVPNIDLHDLISQNSQYCLHFGGHKMAVGLEINASDYDDFVKSVTSQVNKLYSNISDQQELSPDIYLTPADVSARFLDQLELLAPFGCDNPKPNFAIRVEGKVAFSKLGKLPSPHLRLHLDGDPNIVYFRGKMKEEQLLSSCKKDIWIDLEYNYYKEAKIPQAIVKNVTTESIYSPSFSDKLLGLTQLACLNRINSGIVKATKLDNLDRFSGNHDFNCGTAIIAQTKDDINYLQNNKLDNFIISSEPPSNLKNCIIINSKIDYQSINFAGFKNVVFLSAFNNDFGTIKSENVFVLNCLKSYKIDDIRTKCGLIYSAFAKGLVNFNALNIYEIVERLNKIFPQIVEREILVIILALNELNLIKIKVVSENLEMEFNKDSRKVDLNDSKILSFFGGDDE